MLRALQGKTIIICLVTHNHFQPTLINRMQLTAAGSKNSPQNSPQNSPGPFRGTRNSTPSDQHFSSWTVTVTVKTRGKNQIPTDFKIFALLFVFMLLFFNPIISNQHILVTWLLWHLGYFGNNLANGRTQERDYYACMGNITIRKDKSTLLQFSWEAVKIMDNFCHQFFTWSHSTHLHKVRKTCQRYDPSQSQKGENVEDEVK